MNLPDQEHIQRCRHGHPDDFRFLVQRYEGPAFAFALSRVGDRSLAREVAEEAFVRAYFALAKLRKPEAFHSWLLGIVGRVALEFQRGQFRRHEVPAPADAPAFATPVPEPEPAYDGLDEAIAELPPVQRELILLRYFEQLSCQEIADRLHLPLGTVTKTLSRAYTELRTLLQAREATQLEKSS